MMRNKVYLYYKIYRNINAKFKKLLQSKTTLLQCKKQLLQSTKTLLQNKKSCCKVRKRCCKVKKAVVLKIWGKFKKGTVN